MGDENALDRLSDLGWASPVPWAGAATCAEAEERLSRLAGPDSDLLRNPHVEDLWLREKLICQPARRILTPRLGADIAVENVFAVLKRPDRSFEVPWHQDGVNSSLELDPERSLAVWIAITDSSPSNGCIEVASGSHNRGYLEVEVGAKVQPGVGKPTVSVAVEKTGPVAQLSIKAGSACLMDTRLLHRSGPNITASVRIGVNVRFIARGGINRMSDPGKRVLSIEDERQVSAGDYR